MTETRRHFSSEQKTQIERRHVAGKEAVGDLADELGLRSSLINGWVNLVLAQAERAPHGGWSTGGGATMGGPDCPGKMPLSIC